MQVSVESTSNLERKMTVEVPATQIDEAIRVKLQSLTKTVKLPGFRPGKVPEKVVASKYGAQVKAEVVSEITQNSFYEAITKEQLQLVGKPSIDIQPPTDGAGLKYTATFEIYPGIEVTPFETLAVERLTCDITTDALDEMIETLRKQNVKWTDVDRAAQLEDRLTLDFEGKIDGELFDGGAGKAVPLVLGSNAFIAGFEEQLVGIKAGEEKQIDLTFPESYHVKDMAGKPVSFVVKVAAVAEPVLPPLDEEFFKLYEVMDGKLESFRSDVKKNMALELDQVLTNKRRTHIMDKLYEANQFDVPQAMIQNEIARLMEESKHALVKQGVPIEGLNLESSMFDDRAKRGVALSMLVAELVKKHDIKAEPAKIRARIEHVAASYDEPEQIVNWYYADKSRLGSVEALVYEDMIVDLVFEQATVTDKPIDFKEAMNSTR